MYRKMMAPVPRNFKIILLVLFFFSGASALIYQVVWIRMFGLVFGVSAFAIAAVLTSFMAGLGIGNFYFGKRADSSRNPLRLYALLELGLGVYGLCFSVLFSPLKSLCAQLPAYSTSGFLTASFLRFLLSLLVLLVPTILMGGTLPVLSKVFVYELRTIGKRIGNLYSVNNAGAIAGCLAAGFILIMAVGVQGTLYVAVGVNIGIALTAWVVGRRPIVREKVGHNGENAEKVTASAPRDRTFHSKPIIRLVLVLIAVEGFISLAYELVWTRILSAAVLGNSVYSFCIVTAVFILGLSLGSFIIAAIIDKKKDLLSLFAGIEIAIGLSAVLFLFLFSKFPAMTSTPSPYAAYDGLWSIRVAQDLFFSIIVMLVPATLMGMAFPTAAKICTVEINGVGRSIGTIGGLNTAGSILGSFAGGFILISLFGMYHSVTILAFVNVLAGIAVIMYHQALRWRSRLAIGAALCAACTCTAIILPHRAFFWRSTADAKSSERLLYYVEDYAATVAVVETRSTEGSVKCLEVDGIPVAGTEYMLRTTQKVQAHIPLLLYESQNRCRAKKVLAVGLGSGGTSWSAAQHDSGAITCVELVPGVMKAAAHEFTEVNHAIFDSARYTLKIGDGRNHVFTTAERYDVILTESVHPIYAGNASLYSRDYFDLCRKRLSDNGVFSVWLPIYRISRDDFKTVMRTFQSVFPHATVWFTTNSLSRQILLIGTMKKLGIDLQAWTAMASEPKVNHDLKEVHLDDPLKLLDCMIMSEDDIRNFAVGAALHTDDRPRLEFSAPMSAGDFATWKQNLASIIKYKKNCFSCLINYTDTPQTERTLARYDSADKHILAGILDHFEHPDSAIKEYLTAQNQNPLDSSIVYLVGNARNSMINKVHGFQSAENIREASMEFKKLLNVFPGNFEIVNEAALWYGGLQMVDTAEALLNGFLRSHPVCADGYKSLGIVYVNNQQWDKALTALDSAIALNPRLAEAYNTRAIACAGKGLFREALSDLDKAIAIDPATPNVYENRAFVYTRMGRGDLAEKDAALSRLMQRAADSSSNH
jgi:spermidine synthase